MQELVECSLEMLQDNQRRINDLEAYLVQYGYKPQAGFGSLHDPLQLLSIGAYLLSAQQIPCLQSPFSLTIWQTPPCIELQKVKLVNLMKTSLNSMHSSWKPCQAADSTRCCYLILHITWLILHHSTAELSWLLKTLMLDCESHLSGVKMRSRH